MPISLSDLAQAVQRGDLVPYLGPGVLADVRDGASGEPMPALSDDLILAMNQGRPMAPRLMWEFPRAAMDVELKRGRSAVNRFLDQLYGQRDWTRAALHDWLAAMAPPYVIDINRDTQLQDSYAGRPHMLIRGIARVGGTDYRFKLHTYDGEAYREASQASVDPRLPILFKPLGSRAPMPHTSPPMPTSWTTSPSSWGGSGCPSSEAVSGGPAVSLPWHALHPRHRAHGDGGRDLRRRRARRLCTDS